MKFQNFLHEQMLKNFYIDAEEEDGENAGKAKRVVVFTSKVTKNNLTKTVKTLQKFAEDNNIKCKIAFVEDCFIIHDNNKMYISNVNDKEPFEIHYKDTLIINRASIASMTASLDILTQLEKMKFFTVNSRECIETCADKYRTAMRLVEQGLSTPRTSIIRTLDSVDHAIESIGGNFPIIVKTLFGTKGAGVFIAESEKSLKSTLETI